MKKLVYQHNSKYAGQYYRGTTYYTYGEYGMEFHVSVDANTGAALKVQVQLTGYYTTVAGKEYLQTIANTYIVLADGWESVGYAPLRTYQASDAQKYVNKVIAANSKILKNNLFCARFAAKLTPDEQLRLYNLQTRLSERNNQLLADGLCTQQKVSSPPGYNLLSDDLNSFMTKYANAEEISGVGAVISTTTIVVSAVVIAALGTAAFFAYKYMASEAEKDVEYSDELTRTLMGKLTEDEYNQLMKETNGIVTKSKLTSSISGGLGVIKWGLLAAAGVVAYIAYKNYKDKGKKQ